MGPGAAGSRVAQPLALAHTTYITGQGLCPWLVLDLHLVSLCEKRMNVAPNVGNRTRCPQNINQCEKASRYWSHWRQLSKSYGYFMALRFLGLANIT